ncbi:MAG: tetratricopeptide repeat protein [Methylophilaceae bacterium]
MSLLIKALANAEKEKQAERNKNQADETGLPLSLAPKESVPADIAADFTKVEQTHKSEAQLLLEEEAGLGAISTRVVNKSELPTEKSVSEKTSSPASAQIGLSKTQPTAASEVKLEAKLEPRPTNKLSDNAMAAPKAQSNLAQTVDNNQKIAAKVFVANRSAKAPSSMGTLLLLGVGGALLVWLGLQVYNYFTKPAPTIVAVSPPVAPVLPPATVSENVTLPVSEVQVSHIQDQVMAESAEQLPQATQLPAAFAEKNQASVEKPLNQAKNSIASTLTDNEELQSDSTYTKRTPNTAKQSRLKFISKPTATGVDPTLLAAYQAYNRGDDANAQRQYRQVLQHDVRNVDALLGMAAIAQRQGRDADAAGWYQKVLEVEPQNSIAQSAIVSSKANAEVSGGESSIKSMLAQQPEAAYLHAALGNIYAEQNQWASAQTAYFDASRFAPSNADYVFNLAVSLEQLGKPRLAIAQYKRALALLNQSDGTSPDRFIVEARIQALQ